MSEFHKEQIRALLKSEGIDIMDSTLAIKSLSECVAPTRLVAMYLEMLEQENQ